MSKVIGPRFIAATATLAILASIAIVLFRQQRQGGAPRFVLPGWEDVQLFKEPPKDVAWTCHAAQPGDPDDCSGNRDVTIDHIAVIRRPDVGVIAVFAFDVPTSVVEQLRARWGRPTQQSGIDDRVAAVWCSDDRKQGAEIHAVNGGYNVLVGTWHTSIGDECKRAHTRDIATDSSIASDAQRVAPVDAELRDERAIDATIRHAPSKTQPIKHKANAEPCKAIIDPQRVPYDVPDNWRPCNAKELEMWNCDDCGQY